MTSVVQSGEIAEPASVLSIEAIETYFRFRGRPEALTPIHDL
jgi:hypothetical protein